MSQNITPAYVSFVATLKASIEGTSEIQVREVARYVCFESKVNGHKVYVPKNTGSMKKLDTTIPLLGKLKIASPLKKPNGKIECHLEPDAETIVSQVLPLLLSNETRLRENMRPSRASGPTSQPASLTYTEEEIRQTLGV